MSAEIVKAFRSDERFEKKIKKELLSDLLPEIIKAAPADEISSAVD